MISRNSSRLVSFLRPLYSMSVNVPCFTSFTALICWLYYIIFYRFVHGFDSIRGSLESDSKRRRLFRKSGMALLARRIAPGDQVIARACVGRAMLILDGFYAGAVFKMELHRVFIQDICGFSLLLLRDCFDFRIDVIPKRKQLVPVQRIDGGIKLLELLRGNGKRKRRNGKAQSEQKAKKSFHDYAPFCVSNPIIALKRSKINHIYQNRIYQHH